MGSITEMKVAYVYSILLILILGIVIVFLLCDFQVLPIGICEKVEMSIDGVGRAVNKWTTVQ